MEGRLFWPPTFDIFEIFVNVIDRMTSQWWCSVSFSDNLESGLSQREGEIRLKKQKSYFVDPINSFDSHGQSKKAIFTQKPLEFRISYFCWHFWFQPNFLSRTTSKCWQPQNGDKFPNGDKLMNTIWFVFGAYRCLGHYLKVTQSQKLKWKKLFDSLISN